MERKIRAVRNSVDKTTHTEAKDKAEKTKAETGYKEWAAATLHVESHPISCDIAFPYSNTFGQQNFITLRDH